METIVLGGGCFWCVEAGFNLIDGVTKVVSGYAGGDKADADYHRVGSGKTGHAEVVQITFDTKRISIDDILDIFWALHDPTTLNQQGNDVGPQYRSVIFYASPEQQQAAEAAIARVAPLWDNPIVTEVTPLTVFYPAEDYHQRYFENNPENAYCQVIINPKLTKLRQKFAERVKA